MMDEVLYNNLVYKYVLNYFLIVFISKLEPTSYYALVVDLIV